MAQHGTAIATRASCDSPKQLYHERHVITCLATDYLTPILENSLEALLRRLSLLVTGFILIDSRFGCGLIRREMLDLLAIHKLHHIVRLPLLEVEPQAGMRVVLIIRLIFVVLDLDEV